MLLAPEIWRLAGDYGMLNPSRQCAGAESGGDSSVRGDRRGSSTEMASLELLLDTAAISPCSKLPLSAYVYLLASSGGVFEALQCQIEAE